MTWSLESTADESPTQTLVREEIERALVLCGHRIVTAAPNTPDVIPLITSGPWARDPIGPRPILADPDLEDSEFTHGRVAELNRELAGVGCVSSHGLKALIDHGVEAPVDVIGFGVDHWDRIQATPGFALTAKSFRFLHVSACTATEGVDLLLESFGRVFSSHDDVSLVIHCSRGPIPEKLRTLLDHLRQTDPAYPDVVLIEETVSEAELKAVYLQCQVFVAPCRSGGARMRIAQALFLGRPVVATDWGGHLDYCDVSNSWLVDFRFEAPQSDSGVKDAVWATPWPSGLDDALELSRAATSGDRLAKGLAGRDRLLDRFTWERVAVRLSSLAIKTQATGAPVSTRSKVAWLSTYNVPCGIAGHVQHLLAPIPSEEILILAGIQEPRVNPIDPPNCIRCWVLNKVNNGLDEAARLIRDNSINTVVIQHAYGFFNHAELSILIDSAINQGTNVILELHSTVDPFGDVENYRMADLSRVMRRCSRIIVHSALDVDRLKGIGIVSNVMVIPHGVMKPQSGPRKIGLEDSPLIASFGFSFPNKGLVELVQAVGILRDRGRKVRLRMLNAQSPSPDSEPVVKSIQQEIKNLCLEDLIEFRFDYLDDDVCLPLLSEADLIVNPYQQTGESASGAVRYGLATGRPVAVTPLTIFDDLGDAVFRLPGISPTQLADGIDEALHHIACHSETARHVQKSMDRWIDQHDYANHSTLYMALARAPWTSPPHTAFAQERSDRGRRVEPKAPSLLKKPRGAFINTADASCSIFESGKMVYSCLQQSADFEIDYFALDDIELTQFIKEKKIKRHEDQFGIDTKNYDFWVFNWHFITMAPHVPNDVIRALPGPKFSIILELEPDNPLAFIPPHVFDGFIALDPTAPLVGNIYPFPRPLDGAHREPNGRSSGIPIIGSFGYGTPGKGFGLLVEAVNREFTKAIVRINVPPGTYTASMDKIHLQDYPSYLAELCRRIAKPGITVEFTHKFMSQDELVGWCAANDLNCFMYTRRQAGLAATTDQAILSGRPLVTSSNDTFRHIHKFIPPYPITGLREAIETTTPLVRLMQNDWSKAAFGNAFQKMLGDFGVLQIHGLQNTGQGVHDKSPNWKVVIAAPRQADSGDILRHATRLANALGRSGEYDIRRLSYDNIADLDGKISADVDAVILDAPFVDDSAASRALIRFRGVKILMSNHNAQRSTSNATFLETPRLPVIPFFTALGDLIGPRPSIWLIGFASKGSNLDEIVSKVRREAPDAELFFEVPDEDRASLEGRIGLLPSPSPKFSLERLPSRGDALIGRLARDHLLIFYNDPARSDELLDTCSLALTTERAVAFTRAAPFDAFASGATYIEDFTIPDIIAMGIRAHISLYHDFGEWQIFAKVHGLLSRELHDRAAPEAVLP